MRAKRHIWRTARAAAILVAVTACVCLSSAPCAAQSFFTTIYESFPVSHIEKYIGPIFPAGGIGSTFRSEFSTGFSAANVIGAKLIGSEIGERDLRTVMPLEEGPTRYNLSCNLRLWRFGLRAKYDYFETRSYITSRGGFDLSGASAGLDFDLVQRKNAMFGLRSDYYFVEPKVTGRYEELDFALRIKGDKHATAGAYVRIVPAEMAGYPLCLEAFYNVPITNTKLRAYGVSLVFRPTLYRFDVALKMGVERDHVKFDTEPTDPGLHEGQAWEVDMEINMLNFQAVVYF